MRHNPQYDLHEALDGAFETARSTLSHLARGPVVLVHDEEHEDIHHIKLETGRLVSTFGMRAQPGCSAVLVFHKVSVEEPFRGRGLGTVLHDMRIDAARRANRKFLITTTRSNNEPENRILARFQWKRTAEFVSELTGNTVWFWTRHVD